tara:strand:- start:644 stop:1102 length:459 start_codon:yes stop_codon:yes gene_type:complete
MDIRKVKKLIEMLEDSNLEEIEIQEGEESVRLVKSNRQNQSHQTQSIMIPQASSVQEQPPQEMTLQDTLEDKQDSNSIDSPMVGTFYASASPGAKPFVSVGDLVSEGDVVCIVEAMKMMNEIKSEFSGTVLSVNVENSEPVEYGQSLFKISK